MTKWYKVLKVQEREKALVKVQKFLRGYLTYQKYKLHIKINQMVRKFKAQNLQMKTDAQI